MSLLCRDLLLWVSLWVKIHWFQEKRFLNTFSGMQFYPDISICSVQEHASTNQCSCSETCKQIIQSRCFMSLERIPKLTPMRGGSCWRGWRVEYFLEHQRKIQIKLLSWTELPLTSTWDFSKHANPPQVLEPFQKPNSATFETMNTEKLDLKPQH